MRELGLTSRMGGMRGVMGGGGAMGSGRVGEEASGGGGNV